MMSMHIVTVFCLSLACGIAMMDCSPDVAAICLVNPVIEGQAREMQVIFNHMMTFTNNNTFVYLRRLDGPDILHCDRGEHSPSPECMIVNDGSGRLKIRDQSDYMLTLLFDVTPDQLGVYIFGGYVNGAPVLPCGCFLRRADPCCIKSDSQTMFVAIASSYIPLPVIALICFGWYMLS